MPLQTNKATFKCHGLPMDVIESRPKNGYIWRRRQCPECRSRITTYESTVGPAEINRFKKMMFDLGDFVEGAL